MPVRGSIAASRPLVRILIDYRPALRHRTGVGEYVHQTAAALAASGPPDESLTIFSSSLRDRLEGGSVTGVTQVDRRWPVSLLNLAWHRLEWPPVEWLVRGSIDLIHGTHPLLVPTRRAARVVTIYDLDFLDHPERTSSEIRRDYPALVGSHARRADQVIVISRHTAGEVEHRLGVPASKISLCVPGAPDWPRREREPDSDGVILFLGTLEPRKNVGVLLDAYERLIAHWPAAPRLVLAGRPTDLTPAIAERARSAVFKNRVDLPGYIPDTQRLALFSRALVFVLPSHTEGFGLPAVEAMKSGVPVIAANRGALPEAVGTAGRLFDPGDAGALARALEEVLTQPVLRQRMSDEGWQHARQFTWAGTAASTRAAWALAREERERRRG